MFPPESSGRRRTSSHSRAEQVLGGNLALPVCARQVEEARATNVSAFGDQPPAEERVIGAERDLPAARAVRYAQPERMSSPRPVRRAVPVRLTQADAHAP